MSSPLPPIQVETATCIEAEPFALQVTDDSMEPEFARGCIVIVDPTGRVSDGAYVLAELADGFVFRQLRLADGEASLTPLNAGYEAVTIDPHCNAVKGVIVQRAGKRRSYHKRYG